MPSLFWKMVDVLQKTMPRWTFLAIYGSYAAVKNTYNLLIGYGLLKSAYLWKSIDRNGNPIPWFSYPAIEYLEGLDLSELSVLEWGSGYSTLYWSRRAKTVLAIEDSAEWAQRIRPLLNDNASIRLIESINDYATDIKEKDTEFDLIIIDGSMRLECAKMAITKLRKGGVIIFDDADEYPDGGVILRQAGLIEVDFSGFNPISTCTKTTSFFFHCDFRPKLCGAALPLHSVCSHYPKSGKKALKTKL